MTRHESKAASVKLDPYSRKATDAQRRRAMAPLRYPMVLHECPAPDRFVDPKLRSYLGRCSDCWHRLLSQWRSEDPNTVVMFVRYATEGGRCYGKAIENLMAEDPLRNRRLSLPLPGVDSDITDFHFRRVPRVTQ